MTVEDKEWQHNRNQAINLAVLGLHETVELVSGGEFFIVDNAFLYYRSFRGSEVVWELKILRLNVKIGVHCYSVRHSSV